jgi:hypothetical protein
MTTAIPEARVREIVCEEIGAYEARERQEGAQKAKAAWLGLADKLAADGAVTSANRLRSAFGSPQVVERTDHHVRVRKLKFQGVQGVDDSGEHLVDAVGAGGRVTFGEDLSNIRDKFSRDRGGVVARHSPEVEDVFQRHDASPSVGADTPTVGDGQAQVG